MKRIAILLSVIAASSAALAIYDNDTVLGFHALYDSSSTSGNIAIGESAGQEIYKGYNNIIIGNESLFDTHYCYNNIIIGNNIANSANDLRNCINIGGWLNNGRLMDDSVILGDSFFSTKQGGGIFGIGYDNSMSLTNSIIYYKFGTLYFNAKEVVGLPSAGGGYYTGYDLYLSPLGRDDNSGTDAAHPLRTIDACYEKAKTNATVCVFAGEYRFPKSYRATSVSTSDDEYNFVYVYGKTLDFFAVDGKERTFLVGDTHSATNDYQYNSLAFHDGADGYQSFNNFTIKGLTNKRPAEKEGSEAVKYNRPIACGVVFDNCAFVNATTNEYETCGYSRWGGFQQVHFYKCTFDNYDFQFEIDGSNSMPLYHTVTMEDTIFRHCRWHRRTGRSTTGVMRFWGGTTNVRRCALDFDTVLDGSFKPKSSQTTLHVYDSTVVVTATAYTDSPIDFTQYESSMYASNTFFAANCDISGSIGYLGNDNGYALAYTNSHLSADLVAGDLDCLAIRTDGRNDCGWKDSGLAGKKALEILNKAVTLVYDRDTSWTTLYVYKDGECYGTLEMTELPANQTQSSIPRMRNMSSASYTPTTASADDDEDGSVTNGIYTLNFTTSN